MIQGSQKYKFKKKKFFFLRQQVNYCLLSEGEKLPVIKIETHTKRTEPEFRKCPSYVSCKDSSNGIYKYHGIENSLATQWLRLGTFPVVTWVQSLVGELRSGF